jgi:hypothetical protein
VLPVKSARAPRILFPARHTARGQTFYAFGLMF